MKLRPRLDDAIAAYKMATRFSVALGVLLNGSRLRMK